MIGEKGNNMDLNNINVIECNNQYVLVDYSASKPVMISKRVYDILAKIKRGEQWKGLEEEYGKDLIHTVINTIQDLRKRKVIADTDENFYQVGQKAIRKYKEQKIELLEGMIMVSQDCNMACSYCYGGSSGSYNHKGFMSKEMAEKCFRYLLSMGGGREFQKVVFFGGEPLLNMDVIRHIILTWEKIKHLYHGREVYFALTTNGLLLTPEIVEFFRDYHVGVSVSLDGPKEIHDANRVLCDGQASFDKVMKGIELLRKYNMPTSIRATVTKNSDLNKLHNFFEEQKFDVNAIAVVDYPMKNPQREYQMDLNAYRDFMKKEREIINEGCEDILSGKKDSSKAKQMSMSFHRSRSSRGDFPFLCGAGIWLVTFGLDGYIYPCNRLVGHEKFRIGDVEHGFDQNKMAQILTEFLNVSKNCGSCWAASRCKGRCFHQKLGEDESFEELPVELCDIYRENIGETLLFAHKTKKYMKEHKKKFDDAIMRYDADHMLKNFKERYENGE